MNNKGFTLIELVAIVLVLALILLISFPSFLSMGAADEEKKYESMVKDLCLAGESYIANNIDNFNELSTIGSKININISDLISYGNVDKELINPKTNQSIEDDELMYTVSSDGSLDCEYEDK